jgi:hypothetical protein
LNRTGGVRDKKECYDDININEGNNFYDIYDAKLAFCKWQMKNKDYEIWKLCNPKWGVRYDEDDCSFRFLKSKYSSFARLKICWIEKAKLPPTKDRCNNLPKAILEKFDENLNTKHKENLTDEESLDLRYDCFKEMLG